MKTIWTIFLSLFLIANFSNSQDTLYIYKAGDVVYKQAVSEIDSMTFNVKRINNTPWEVSDSVYLSPTSSESYTCNNKYVIFSNQNKDSIFVMDIANHKIISSKAFETYSYFILKDNVLIIPLNEYSFSAWDISDIQNWSLIQTYSGLDKGVLYWQFISSSFGSKFYYWIGHWAQSLQVFEINNNTITQHSKFNVGVNSQMISSFNNSLFVASNYSNNKKYDITNLDNPIDLGSFGNSRSSINSISSAGLVLQNQLVEWGGNESNMKLYSQSNTELSRLSTYNTTLNNGYLLPNGYCLLNNGIDNDIYDVNNGSFVFISKIPYFTRVFNDKYLVAKKNNKFYFINRK